MKEIYLLETNVRSVEGEWLTGFTAPYLTAESALEGLKLWCLDNYIDPDEATEGLTNTRYSICNDTELYMEDYLVCLSWGINHMEVRA